MVYSPKIGPDGAFVNEFRDVRRRVQSLESRPTGEVVVRENIKTVDPNTGVETVFGQLPDGSYGLQPYIYDITPPPVASKPTVKSEPGLFIVTWDGLFVNLENAPKDFECVNIIGFKMNGTTTVSSQPVGMIVRPLDITYISTDVAAPGEEWQFALESEDYNGNRAAWGQRTASIQMQSLAVDVDLGPIQAEIDQANQNASSAQTVASAAQIAADKAAQTANSKGKTIIQSTAPAVADQLPQNLWIDTTNGANTPKRWNTTTSTWVAVTDKIAIDAAAVAATAQTRADQAYNSAVTAANAAGTAQTSADGKNRNWYQTSAPAGISHKDGDVWFDTDDGNKIYLWKGAPTNAWTNFQDSAISTAQTAATNASTAASTAQTVAGTASTKADTAISNAKTADDKAAQALSDALNAGNLAASKGKILYQNTAPTGADANALTLWIDTTNSANTPKRWTTGTTWVTVTDKIATDAASLASTKGKILFQTTAPTGADASVLTLWIDTTGGANTPKRWVSGTTWAVVTDKVALDAATAAQTAATAAQTAKNAADAAQLRADQAFNKADQAAFDAGTAITAANGKSTNWSQAAAPAGTGHRNGDTWFDTDDGNKPYTWNSTSNTWVSIQDGAISALDTKVNQVKLSADGKNTIYYQTTQPTGGVYIKGDTWFDTDDAFKMYIYPGTGTAWILAQDSATALTEARGKSKTTASNTAPTGASTDDLWIDTGNSNQIKRWSGTAWVDARDGVIEANRISVLGVANSKNKSSLGSTAPVSPTAGDLWIDSANGNQIKRWSGSAWIDARDTTIIEKANAAKDVAVGMLTISTGDPTGTPVASGATWYKTNSAGTLIIGMWTSNVAGNEWVVRTLDDTVIGNLNAGKILAGIIDADRIGANTLSVTKLLVGATDNLIDNPKFLKVGTGWAGQTAGSGSGWDSVVTYADNENSYRMAQQAAGASNMSLYAPTGNFIAVEPGESFRVSSTISIDGAVPVNASGYSQQVYFYNSAKQQLSGTPGNLTAGGKVTSLTVNTWSTVGGIVTVPAGAAYMRPRLTVYMTAGVTPTAGKVYLGQVQVFRAADGSLIVDGTITAGSAIIANGAIGNAQINNLNADKLDAGTVSADRIAANSIDASKVLISGSNMATDPNFLDPSGWNNPASVTFSKTAGMTGSGAIIIPGTTSQVGAYYGFVDPNKRVLVRSPKDALVTSRSNYRVSVWVKPTVTAPVNSLSIYVRAFNEKNSPANITLPAKKGSMKNDEILTANVWYEISAAFEIPFGYNQVALGVYAEPTFNSGSATFSNLFMQAMSDGQLIVDGAIVAGSAIIADGAIDNAKIKDATITSAKIQSITAGQIISGYISSGLIEAESILADKLVTGVGTNLVTDPNFQSSDIQTIRKSKSDSSRGSWEWSSATQDTTLTVGSSPGQIQWVLRKAPSGVDATPFPIDTGRKYKIRFEAFRPTGTAPAVRANISWKSQTGAVSYVIDGGANYTLPVENAWNWVDREWTPPATAVAFGVDLVVASSGVADGLKFRSPSVRSMTDATIIEDGAIKTVHITSGTLDASVIAAGTINAGMIAAKTIGVDKLTISSTDNLILEADFGNGGSSWQTGSNRAIVTTAGRASTPAMRISGVTSAVTSLNVVNKMPVGSEDRFRALISVKSNAAMTAGRVLLRMRCYTSAIASTDVTIASNPAYAANVWTPVTAYSPVLPTGTIAVEFFLSVTNPATTTLTDIDYVQVTRAADGNLIVDGSVNADKIEANSITATNGIIASLDAAKITTGEMLGSRIKAKTIQADRLVISSTDNLILEADFSNGGSSWQTGGTTRLINATAGRGGLPAFRWTNSTSAQTSLNLNNKIPVGPEDRFRALMSVKPTVAVGSGRVLLYMKCYTTAVAATDVVIASSGILAANVWDTVTGYSPMLPAGTIAVEFYMRVTNPTTATITDVDFVQVTRASDGNLVVDGAIDGKTITGATFQTTATANRGVTLNSLGINSWNSSGQKTFSLSASTGAVEFTGSILSGSSVEGATITGGIIRTSTGAKRIEIQDRSFGSDIRLYGPDNTKYGIISYATTDETPGSGVTGDSMMLSTSDPSGSAAIPTYMLMGNGGHTSIYGKNNISMSSNYVSLNSNISTELRSPTLYIYSPSVIVDGAISASYMSTEPIKRVSTGLMYKLDALQARSFGTTRIALAEYTGVRLRAGSTVKVTARIHAAANTSACYGDYSIRINNTLVAGSYTRGYALPGYGETSEFSAYINVGAAQTVNISLHGQVVVTNGIVSIPSSSASNPSLYIAIEDLGDM